jgi:hypothetical protein
LILYTMARRFCYILLLLAFALHTNAQNLGVKWGESYKNRKNSYITKIIGEDEDGYYAFRYSGGYVFSYVPHIWLDKYSNFSLAQQFSKEMEIPTRSGEEVMIEDMLQIKGRFILLTSFFNRDASKKSVFAYGVDSTGKVQTKNSREVDYIPSETRRDNRREFVALSSDSAALFFYHTEYNDKNGNERLVCRLVDGQTLSERYFKSIDIPYKKEQVNIINGISDADGNFFVLLRIGTIEKNAFFKDKSQYSYLLISIAADEKVKEYDLNLGTRTISEIVLKRAPDGNILLAGFYSNNAKSADDMAGTFYIRIDGKTGNIGSKGVKDFDKDFLALFMSDKKIDKGRELYKYKLNDVIIRPDQGVILIAEQTYEDVICFFDNRTGLQTCNTHYHYNDIIVISINPDGNVAWTRKIPKQQETINDDGLFSSYLLYQRNQTLYMLFNDDIRNFTQQALPFGTFDAEPFNMTAPHKAQVAVVTIDSTGYVAKKPFFNSKDSHIIIRPSLSYKASSDVTIIYGEYGNRFRMGKLIYNADADSPAQ